MMSTGSNILLFKTAVILIVFCFAECAAGTKFHKSSCLKYGHSCWGGHGKRNGGSDGGGRIMRGRDLASDANTRWYLSRLVQAPPELKLWQDGQERRAIDKRTQDQHIQNDSEIDMDIINRIETAADDQSLESLPDDSETEEIVLLEEPSMKLGQKLRLYKLMKKKGAALN